MSDMKCPNIKIYKCSDGFVTDNAQVAKSHEANIKSNKLICPFCQQAIMCMDTQEMADEHSTWYCPRCIAEKAWYAFGNKTLWQELMRTRKALDVAVDALKDNLSQANFREMLDASRFHCIRTKCESALEQITALEQKE